MKEIDFTNLMGEFGTEILKRKKEWKFFEKVWYMINWNNRKLRNLQSWCNANKGVLWSDKIVREHINGLNNLYPKPTQNHRKAIAVLRFVKKYITYVGDTKVWGCGEYWQTPLETWTLKTGDCEDGAILINELMRMAKIPSYQREVRVGWVKMPGSKKGGHAYTVYTSELDARNYELDWCYNYDNTPIDKRVPLEDKKNYLDIWFCFNESYSYKKVKNPNKKFTR